MARLRNTATATDAAGNSASASTQATKAIVTSLLKGDFDQNGQVNAADILAGMQALTNLNAYKVNMASQILTCWPLGI